MKSLEEIFDPVEIQDRINEITRHRPNLALRIAGLKSSDEISDEECSEDIKLSLAFAAWKKLQQITQEIKRGVRLPNGELSVA